MHRLSLLAIALLLPFAGCVEPEPAEDGDGTASPTSTTSPGGGGPGFAPQQGSGHASHEGIDLDVTWRACEEGFCANATARNNGTQNVQVSSICVEPWDERMTKDGAKVQPHEDQAVCLAYGRKAFAPGDEAQHDFTWDGRLHSRDAKGDDVSTPAPEGAYTWTLVFWWEDDTTTRQEASVDVHLIVGET